VGSRLKNNHNLAYIAGFLDGDGSLMFQIKKRKDGKIGWRFMFTICFYQDSRHASPLRWIRKELGIGYVSKRNDGMTELRVNGFYQIKQILIDLIPYIRFKQKQAEAMLRAARILTGKTTRQLSQRELMQIASCMTIVQRENYTARHKKTEQEIMGILGLTP